MPSTRGVQLDFAGLPDDYSDDDFDPDYRESSCEEDAVDDLDAFIDAHCGKFASWSGTDGEQQLEWTTLHAEYVVVVEAAIAEALRELSCKEEDVFAYAELHGGDASVDKAMTRLLALAEYSKFCKMMHAHSDEEELRGSMGVMGL